MGVSWVIGEYVIIKDDIFGVEYRINGKIE